MEKTKMKKMKQVMMATVLGSTILLGGLTQSVDASPLWLTNYLEGKTTSANEVGQTEELEQKSTQNQNTTEDSKDSGQTNVADQPQDTSQSANQRWNSNDYWRSRTNSSSFQPSTSDPIDSQSEQLSSGNASGGELNGVVKEEQVLYELLNQEREKRGLQPLRLNGELTRLARLKAKDMADNNYFSHTSPTYGKAVDMVREAGIDHWIVSENIARTTSGARANTLFMGSTTHRSTMLNSRFTEVGIGMYREANGTLHVTEIFIGTR